MVPFKLKKWLTKQPQSRALIELIDPDIIISDAEGVIVFGSGQANDPNDRQQVQVGETLVGWVSGGKHAALVAKVLAMLALHEIEKNELADQTLELYREVNLMYELAEKLTSSLDIEIITTTIVTEVKRIIAVDHALVILHDSTQEEQERYRSFPEESLAAFNMPDDLASRLASNGKAELINDITIYPDLVQSGLKCCSLAYAPLKIKDQSIGCIVVVNQQKAAYRASDLKILTTIAAQAAPAIDSALLFQRSAREAAEREARLQQQIQDLRIEIDEKRQQQKVVEITETSYFRSIRSQREALRKLLLYPDDNE